jgi:hypothetical protein
VALAWVGSVAAARGGVVAGAVVRAVEGSTLRAAPAPERVAVRDALRSGAIQAKVLAREEVPSAPSQSTPAVRAVPAPHAATRPAAPQLTTGLVRVPPSVRGMLIDGAPTRVERGAIVVACGPHTAKTGFAPSRRIDVPCGGTAWMF